MVGDDDVCAEIYGVCTITCDRLITQESLQCNYIAYLLACILTLFRISLSLINNRSTCLIVLNRPGGSKGPSLSMVMEFYTAGV